MGAPELAPRLAATLAALRADGITQTDAEIVWLARLRDKCDRPADHSIAPLFNAPLRMFGLAWWPLHALADDWFRGMFAGHEDADGMAQAAFFLFAHIYSAPGDWTLRDMTDRAEAAVRVAEWRRGVPIHDEQVPEFVRLLRALDGDDADYMPPRTGDAEPAPARSFIAAMSKTYPGLSPDYWMAGISVAECNRLLDAAMHAQAGDFAGSPARGRAIADYLRAVKEVRASHAQP